jgi:hypothetical protein
MPSKKSESVKQAVVAMRLQGESKRQIAKGLAINRATVDTILDESQVEASLAQWRRDYLQLVPTALKVAKKFLEEGEQRGAVDKDAFNAALQVLKGTGVHEERTRSRNDVRVTQDLTNATDTELDQSISDLLATPQPPAQA